MSTGGLVPTWGSAARLCGPGCQRLPAERAAVHCGGAVALNLPRLALRAGPWREDRVLEALSALIDQAVDVLERQSAYQRRLHPRTGRTRLSLAPAPQPSD